MEKDSYITLKQTSELTGRSIKTLRKIVSKPEILTRKTLVKNRQTVFVSVNSLIKQYPEKQSALRKFTLNQDSTQDGTHITQKSRGTIPTNKDNQVQNNGYDGGYDDPTHWGTTQLINSLNNHIQSLQSQIDILNEMIRKKDNHIDALIKSKEHSDILVRELNPVLKLEEKIKLKPKKFIEYFFKG